MHSLQKRCPWPQDVPDWTGFRQMLQEEKLLKLSLPIRCRFVPHLSLCSICFSPWVNIEWAVLFLECLDILYLGIVGGRWCGGSLDFVIEDCGKGWLW